MTTTLQRAIEEVCLQTVQILTGLIFLFVGGGQPGPFCGDWVVTHRSDNWDRLKYGYHGCNDPECPVCALKWIREQTEDYLRRIWPYVKTHGGWLMEYEVRVTGGTAGWTWDELVAGLRRKGMRELKKQGITTLYQFFHPFDNDGTFNPHFHVLGVGGPIGTVTVSGMEIRRCALTCNINECVGLLKNLLKHAGKRRGTKDRLSGPCGVFSGPRAWHPVGGPDYIAVMHEVARALGKVYDEIADEMRWPSRVISTEEEPEPCWVSIKLLPRDIAWARSTQDPRYLANWQWWDYLAAVQAGQVEGKNPLLLYRELETDTEVRHNAPS